MVAAGGGKRLSAFCRRSCTAASGPLSPANTWRRSNRAAQAAVRVKGSIFEVTFRRLLPRLEYRRAIWAIMHRLCRLPWKILHEGVWYEKRGPEVSAKSKRTRTARMIKELRKLGYRVAGEPLAAGNPA